MPEWMHERAEHISAKNPSMSKGEAFAIATQQMHALGKSPKGYGTAEGRATAKKKFTTPKDDVKAANPGNLDSPKMDKKAEAFWDELQKIAFKLQGHTTVQGLRIAIENQKGSVRSGVDRGGKPWRTEMKHPYGYIKGTRGADGEEIDVYVGPDKKAPDAHVVHQRKSTGKGYDEDKVMLGFKDIAAARKAYLAHYNSPKFLGPISTMPVETLKKIMNSGKKLVAPKSEKTAWAKLALTRAVQEYMKGGPEEQAQIARVSGQLGLKPRYVSDISEGGQEAGVDKMIGAGHAPGTVPAPVPALQQRLEQYRGQKAGLGLEGRQPSPGVIQSPAGRAALGVQAPASAPAPVAGENESGVLARKMYKPDSLLHRGEFTPQVLQQKQEFTDTARAISPEARSMVPAMYGHQVLHADKGPELQRATSMHEYVPGMQEFRGALNAGAIADHVDSTVLAPMAQKGMVLGDTVSRRGINYGNVVQSPSGPKVVDFLPSDRRAGSIQSPMISSGQKYTPTGENSLFHEKAQLPMLRKEVFNPQLQVQPGGGLRGNLPPSELNKVLHPHASFTPAAPARLLKPGVIAGGVGQAAQGAMGAINKAKPLAGLGKAIGHIA